jgi:hypothetical protein
MFTHSAHPPEIKSKTVFINDDVEYNSPLNRHQSKNETLFSRPTNAPFAHNSEGHSGLPPAACRKNCNLVLVIIE